MMSGIFIVGTGDHARVVLDGARAGKIEVVAFVEPRAESDVDQIQGIPIIADWAALRGQPFIVAIGDNEVRRREFERGLAFGGRPMTLVHPSATILGGAVVGEGTHVAAGAVIGTGSTIGANVIVNTGAIIDHDNVVADHAFIAPGSVLAGRIRVEERAHVGLGAVILEGRVIGSRAYVAAGATVIRDVPPGTRVAGMPAKTMKTAEES